MRSTIVIATFNRPAMAERSLKSLVQCRLPAGVDICVVENGPRSGVEEICRSSAMEGRVRYLYCERAQKSAALNFAVRESEAKFFIFLDDDMLFPVDLIEAYVSAAQRYGTGHFFGGPLAVDAEVPCPAHLFPFLPPSARSHTFGDGERAIPVEEFDFFFGGNWAAFGSDLLSSELFSEKLGVAGNSPLAPVAEEKDIQMRMMRSSVKAVYLPAALVHHFVGGDCYRLDWVRNRRFRTGVAACTMVNAEGRPLRSVRGIPYWVLRRYLQAQWSLAMAYVLFRPLIVRTECQMYVSYFKGWLYYGLQAPARTATGR